MSSNNNKNGTNSNNQYWLLSLPLKAARTQSSQSETSLSIDRSSSSHSSSSSSLEERKQRAFELLQQCCALNTTTTTTTHANDESSSSNNPNSLSSMISKIQIPQDMKIGTLDSLLSLSDDVQKIVQTVEQTQIKIKRQISEIGEQINKEKELQRTQQQQTRRGGGGFEAEVILNVDGISAHDYLKDFKWDEAKNPAKRQLRETVEKITEHVAKIDDELKVKLSEFVMAKNSLSTITRKMQGSLATRDLGDVVKEEHMIETENLTTLLVTVPKFSQQDWLESYETLAQFVVPRSSKLLKEESDYALFTVTLFRRTVDSFKSAVREKSGQYQVREYDFDKEKIQEKKEEKQSLEDEVTRRRNELYEWCQTSYGEVFSSWIHIVVVRLFVESILRYGLPPAFQAVVVRPKERQEKKLRAALDVTFGNGSSSHWSSSSIAEGGDVGGGGGLGGERGSEDCHPYVSFAVTL